MLSQCSCRSQSRRQPDRRPKMDSTNRYTRSNTMSYLLQGRKTRGAIKEATAE